MEWACLGLIALGLLISLIGGIWFLVEAFKESVLWGLGCLLCGIVSLLFLIQFWRVAKRPFLVSLLGNVLCFGGSFLLGVSQASQGAQPFTPQAVAVPALPAARGAAEDLPGRIVRHEIALGSGRAGYYDPPGHGGRLWVYLPAGFAAAGKASLPCVLVAPAGTSGLTGVSLGTADEAEHLPYVEAGYVVVAYELDGPLAEGHTTDADELRACEAFRAAQAGLVNARNALEYVLQRLPEVSPGAIFAAGHSSAGAHALLFAAHEPRLAGCLAYAPLVDVYGNTKAWCRSQGLNGPGLLGFARRASPSTHAARLRCPTFLFHSEDDPVVAAAESGDLARRLQAGGTPVTRETVPSGDHYQTMIDQGIPAGLRWLEERLRGLPGVSPAALPAGAGSPEEARPEVAPRAGDPAGRTEWDDPRVVLALVQKGDADDRREALSQWIRRKHDRAEGARLAMLRALGTAAAEPVHLRVLLRSVAESPPGAREALACLEPAPTELRRELLLRLLRRPDPELPVAEALAVVEKLPETPDLLVEEFLLRHGQAREGALGRIVTARSPEWARSEEAQALLAAAPASELFPLASAPEEPTRLLAIRLLRARGAEVAVGPLGVLLRDPAPAVRQEAAGGLGELGDARAVVPLMAALGAEQDEPTRARMRKALANLPAAEVLEVLRRLLGDPVVEQRLLAISGLLAYASPAGVRELGRALSDKELAVRKAGLEALGSLRTSRVQGVPEGVRQHATAIGKLAQKGADAEEQRLAKHLYYQLTGRMP